MSDIDDITAGLESLNIGTYEAAYEKIVSFIKEDLKHTIGAKEEEVTRVLAGPFTHGGLLILLQEPRLHHPWGDGVHEVIDDCDSLKVLNEGFNLISDGRLNLTNGISVLDMRPFLAEKYHSKLDKWQWERLYDLVYNAIVAKKPDVLLCMGKVTRRQSKQTVLRNSLTQTRLQKKLLLGNVIHGMRSVYRTTESFSHTTQATL